MTIKQLNKFLGNIDIYLLDQILKNRIPKTSKILDAGCGEGRNLIYFLNNGYDVRGMDQNAEAIRMLHFIIGTNYAQYEKHRFTVGDLLKLPYQDEEFNYIICSAVLHFASSETDFWKMFDQIHRVLGPGGTLFVRMASSIGLKNHQTLGEGKYLLPDGSRRFLLTEAMISKMITFYGYSKLEPVKTVLVEEQRCMTTLILNKKPLLT